MTFKSGVLLSLPRPVQLMVYVQSKQAGTKSFIADLMVAI